MTTPRHVPVLLDRVVALVAPALDGPDRDRTVFVDATLVRLVLQVPLHLLP